LAAVPPPVTRHASVASGTFGGIGIFARVADLP